MTSRAVKDRLAWQVELRIIIGFKNISMRKCFCSWRCPACSAARRRGCYTDGAQCRAGDSRSGAESGPRS